MTHFCCLPEGSLGKRHLKLSTLGFVKFCIEIDLRIGLFESLIRANENTLLNSILGLCPSCGAPYFDVMPLSDPNDVFFERGRRLEPGRDNDASLSIERTFMCIRTKKPVEQVSGFDRKRAVSAAEIVEPLFREHKQLVRQPTRDHELLAHIALPFAEQPFPEFLRNGHPCLRVERVFILATEKNCQNTTCSKMGKFPTCPHQYVP